jgi:hypothetical protein
MGQRRDHRTLINLGGQNNFPLIIALNISSFDRRDKQHAAEESSEK